MIILVRKFAIVITANQGSIDATFQMCIILLVCFASYGLLVRVNPYMSVTERKRVLITYLTELELINASIAEINRTVHIPRKPPHQ